MLKIKAWTDGSAVTKRVNEELLGGIGAYIYYENGKEKFISRGYKFTTISRMELMAVLFVLREIDKNEEVFLTVFSDSSYVVNSLNEGWVYMWERENWNNRFNSDLWKMVLKEIREHTKMKLKMVHIRGHQKDKSENSICNNIADRLANYKIHKEYTLDLK